MRFLCASVALGVGLLSLAPEPAEACHRRGARGGGYAVAAPAYYPSAPGYYPSGCCPPGGYHAGGYPQPTYGLPGGAYPPGAYPPGGYLPGGVSPPAVMPSPSPSPSATKAAAVTALDNKFDPPTITVAPGTTVRWTNKGEHKHSVTSTTGAFDSGELAPGQGYSTTFTKAGTFEYYCKLHKEMKGTVIVK